jgi:hypothetical protein
VRQWWLFLSPEERERDGGLTERRVVEPKKGGQSTAGPGHSGAGSGDSNRRCACGGGGPVHGPMLGRPKRIVSFSISSEPFQMELT